jgi:hypothetical protein
VYEHEPKPIWTSATFLVYAGGLTVLLGGLLALLYLRTQYGNGAKTGWALLILVILYGIAHALRIGERPIAAGIFAFASVIAWGAFVIYLFRWAGWHGVDASIKHWSWSRPVAELLVLAAAWDDRRRFRFPFIRVISAIVAWLFVIDLITAGGNFTAAVTLIVGLVYLGWGWVQRTPSSFWLHFVGGALIGGAILHWCHTSDGDYAVVSIVAFLYVLLAYATKRSSWAVFATIGFYVATIHYIIGSPTQLVEGFFGVASSGHCIATSAGTTTCTSTGTSISPWSPALALGLLGFFLVLLGLLGRRRTAATLAPPAE